MYIILQGEGRDGGFGDYCSPNWTLLPPLMLPMNGDSKAVVFNDNDKQVAETLVKELNDISDKVFYRDPHDMYDGVFPFEFTVFWLPFDIPQDDKCVNGATIEQDIIQHVTTLLEDSWADNRYMEYVADWEEQDNINVDRMKGILTFTTPETTICIHYLEPRVTLYKNGELVNDNADPYDCDVEIEKYLT